MSWLFPDWDTERRARADRTEIPEAGGWMYRIRDANNAYSSVFVPDITLWANAIGQAMVLAQLRLVPTAVKLDLTRVRHAKQPKPGPKT